MDDGRWEGELVLLIFSVPTDYTTSHTQINPFSITPVGPVPDILPLDEELPAVRFALEQRKK